MTDLVQRARRKEGELCRGSWTPALADHAQVRPPGKLIWRGKAVNERRASHNFSQAQFRPRCRRRKGAQEKSSDVRKKPGGDEK